jgi:hypothetical protein
MRAPLRHHDLPDHASAARTFLSCASVHGQLDLKFPARSVGAAVVAKRRPPCFDGALEDEACGRENRGGVLRSARARRQWVNLRQMQRFIDVDVSETRDDMLVQQQ